MFDPPSYVVATLRGAIASFEETLPRGIRVSEKIRVSERLGYVSNAAAQWGMRQDVCEARGDKRHSPRRSITLNPGAFKKMDEDV